MLEGYGDADNQKPWLLRYEKELSQGRIFSWGDSMER